MNIMEIWMTLDELEGSKKKKRLHRNNWYKVDELVYVPTSIWNIS